MDPNAGDIHQQSIDQSVKNLQEEGLPEIKRQIKRSHGSEKTLYQTQLVICKEYLTLLPEALPLLHFQFADKYGNVGFNPALNNEECRLFFTLSRERTDASIPDFVYSQMDQWYAREVEQRGWAGYASFFIPMESILSHLERDGYLGIFATVNADERYLEMHLQKAQHVFKAKLDVGMLIDVVPSE